MSHKPDLQKSTHANEPQESKRKRPFVQPKLTRQDSLVRLTLEPGRSGE